VLANFSAIGLFFALLAVAPGATEGPMALLLALVGALVAVTGSAVVLRSRAELGRAWSVVPIASEDTGVVTTGLYRLVRHPIYLGFSVLALGQAIAFGSTSAILAVVGGVLPSFLWRARAEEKLLLEVFGERYVTYRKHTKVMIPGGLLRPLLLGFVLAAIVWSAWQFDLPRYMSVGGMRALVEAHARYGALVFMAVVVAGLFTRVPMMGTVLVAVGALLFGRLAAFAYGWLAALVGTTAIFLLVRSVARDYVRRALDASSDRLRALDERVSRNGFGTVLVLRLVFGLAPFLNWGLGLTGVRLPQYCAATALGLVPNLAVTVLFADNIVSRPTWVVAGGTLVVVAIATASVWRRLRDTKRVPPTG
jgi:protein-S-isoprenylcysteine O-methyltransferase Ste14